MVVLAEQGGQVGWLGRGHKIIYEPDLELAIGGKRILFSKALLSSVSPLIRWLAKDEGICSGCPSLTTFILPWFEYNTIRDFTRVVAEQTSGLSQVWDRSFTVSSEIREEFQDLMDILQVEESSQPAILRGIQEMRKPEEERRTKIILPDSEMCLKVELDSLVAEITDETVSKEEVCFHDDGDWPHDFSRDEDDCSNDENDSSNDDDDNSECSSSEDNCSHDEDTCSIDTGCESTTDAQDSEMLEDGLIEVLEKVLETPCTLSKARIDNSIEMEDQTRLGSSPPFGDSFGCKGASSPEAMVDSVAPKNPEFVEDEINMDDYNRMEDSDIIERINSPHSRSDDIIILEDSFRLKDFTRPLSCEANSLDSSSTSCYTVNGSSTSKPVVRADIQDARTADTEALYTTNQAVQTANLAVKPIMPVVTSASAQSVQPATPAGQLGQPVMLAVRFSSEQADETAELAVQPLMPPVVAAVQAIPAVKPAVQSLMPAVEATTALTVKNSNAAVRNDCDMSVRFGGEEKILPDCDSSSAILERSPRGTQPHSSPTPPTHSPLECATTPTPSQPAEATTTPAKPINPFYDKTSPHSATNSLSKLGSVGLGNIKIIHRKDISVRVKRLGHSDCFPRLGRMCGVFIKKLLVTDFHPRFYRPAPYSVKLGRRSRRCNQCPTCLREDCRTCINCLDRKVYGGPGLKKQACKFRICQRPLVKVG